MSRMFVSGKRMSSSLMNGDNSTLLPSANIVRTVLASSARAVAVLLAMLAVSVASAFALAVSSPDAEPAFAEKTELKVGGKDFWYPENPYPDSGNFTNKFTLEGHLAFCCEPAKTTPPPGEYTIQEICPKKNTTSEYIHPQSHFDAAMYFGYGGPGYDASLFPTVNWDGDKLSENDKIVVQHLVVSFFYTNSSYRVAQGGGDKFRNWVNRYITGFVDGELVYENASVQKLYRKINEVPDGFHAFSVNGKNTHVWTDGGDQTIIGWRWENGDLELQKRSASTSITNGNDNYSLNGAKYGVYSSQSDAKNNRNRKALLTTNSKGYAKAEDLTADTYYIKEISASPGYEVDPNVYKTTVVAGGTMKVGNKDLTEVPQTGNVPIDNEKHDADTAAPVAQGDAKLAGAQFTVKFYDVAASKQANAKPLKTWVLEADEDGRIEFDDAHKVSGDAFYKKDGKVVLPLGSISWEETKAPEGYALPEGDETVRRFDVVAGKRLSTITTEDEVLRGGVSFQKHDADLTRAEAQGDASFAGCEITLYNRSDAAVIVDGVEYASDEAIAVFVLDETGAFATASDYLPYGTYELKETAGNDAYRQNADWSYEFQIRSDGQMIDATAVSDGVNDEVKRGGFEIQKWDAELGRTEPQGDGDYAGVHIVVYNRSAGIAYVNGAEHAPGSVCFEFDLDAAGCYRSAADLLPYGTYELRETEGSDNGSYYADNAWTQTIEIRKDGEIIPLTTIDKGPNDQILRGGVAVQKFASEVSDGTIGKSQNGEFPDLRLGSTAGIADTVASGDSQRFVDMIVAAAGGNDTFTADMFGMKNGESQATASDPMAVAQAGAAFKGAEVTVYNASEHSVNIEGKGVVEVGGVVAVLTLDANGYAETDARALPYGTYTLKETKAPEGYHLNENWSKTVEVREEGKIYEVGDLPEDKTGFSGVDDQVVRGDYKFVKNAADSQNTLPFTPFLLVNLQSGENHVITTNENGEFYTNSYIDGNPYNLHSNNTNANDESITWNEDGTYEIDDSKLDNFAGVWFTGYGPLNDPDGVLAKRVEPNDSLGALPYGDYVLIELNADSNTGYSNIVRPFTISREGFTINGGTATDEWIEIELQTTAKDAATGDNYGSLESDVTTIIDDISFSAGLRSGNEYEFVGVLMDKATNESIKDVDGNEITASVKHVITADEAANGGTVEVVFEDVPSDLLRGKATVVFEDLYAGNGTWIAAHADIGDEGQTVYYPDIHTTATDGITSDHEGFAGADRETVVINDEVAYSGLKIGETYVMTGTLMDKATGEELEGVEPVSVEFVAEANEGTIVVSFEVPAELLLGKTVVVFESCHQGEREVAVHADIDDEGQTVKYPEIGTQAVDGFDRDKVFSGQKTVTLVDTVEYNNLAPGIEYVMVGTLMDKQTGAPVAGVEAVAQKFVPETADGTMEMTFTFSVVDLVGHDIVVFEDLYRDFNANGETTDNERIAQHADINDSGQTVNVRDAGLADELMEQSLAQTGADGISAIISFMAVAVCAASIAAVVRKTKRRNE